MFEQASRLKLRFNTSCGHLSVEDLWDLPLTSRSSGKVTLDSVARGIYRALKAAEGNISFVEPKTSENTELQLQFDLVKHIIDVRVAEQKAQQEAQEIKERKQRILSIIAEKEDSELSSKSLEELRIMVGAL